jgi:3',5'-cyclic AMP phosphodiesterase CpdA
MSSNYYRRAVSLTAIALIACVVGVSVAEEPADFTIVLLPDTQNYSESFPDTYLAQTEWIKDRAGDDNIKFVIHLGDIVQNYNDAEEEWKVADRAHRVLDGVVPYSVVPGNHDMGMVGKKLTRDTLLYNKYFPPGRFDKYPWYGGHYGEGNDNNYCLFDAGGMKFLVLSLELYPRDETLAWAGRVLEEHRDHRVIVATHCYMRPEGRDKKGGLAYRMAGASGEELWDKFIRKHENIFMAISGHVLGVGLQTNLNDAGLPVHEMLVDYQGLPNGGDGWLRILRFVPSENKIHVKGYSPLLDETNEHSAHTFTLDYQMSSASRKKAG